MLHFWLSCAIRAFWESAFFKGTNKTGFIYAVIVEVLGILWAARLQAQHEGWRSVMRGWLVVLGKGTIVALAAWVAVFFYQLIRAPSEMYAESEARTVTTSTSSAQAKLNWATEMAQLRDSIAEARGECAATKGVNQTLQNQSRDQQSTINGCLSQAMKLLTPGPLEWTPKAFEVDRSNSTISVSRWLIFTNKTVPSVDMVITCDSEIQQLSGKVVGDASNAGSGARLSDKSWELRVTSPAWEPTAPVLVNISTRGSGVLTCSFNRR